MKLQTTNPYRRLALQVAHAMGLGALSAVADGCDGDVLVHGAADNDGNGPSTTVSTVAVSSASRDGGARVRPLTRGLSAKQRAVLSAAWLKMALDNQASNASFARFTLRLLAIGAPTELVRASERAARDEIAHAELCFELASVYAARPLGPGRLDSSSSLGNVDPVELARGVFREGCIGGTISSLVADRGAARCVDPPTRRALEVIARNKARHAELAWRYLGWSAQRHDGVLDAIESELADLRDACVRAPVLRESHDGRWMQYYGQLGDRQRRRAAQRTVHRVIIPCAEVLLDLSPSSGTPRRAA